MQGTVAAHGRARKIAYLNISALQTAEVLRFGTSAAAALVVEIVEIDARWLGDADFHGHSPYPMIGCAILPAASAPWADTA